MPACSCFEETGTWRRPGGGRLNGLRVRRLIAMGFVDYEVEGHVGIMTINRPKALNALNEDVLKDLGAAFDAVDLDEIRVVILTGAGEKSFVAGADIAAMSTMTKAEGEAFGKFGNDVFRKIEVFPVPVIAAVNGFALGGGNELAMSCDIRICSENAVFGQPEVGLGITPGFGGTQRLARLIGIPAGRADGRCEEAGVGHREECAHCGQKLQEGDKRRAGGRYGSGDRGGGKALRRLL